MTLVEHLAELRVRIIRALIAFVLGGIVGYVFFESILDVLIQPYCDIPSAYRDATGRCALVAGEVLEAFSVRMKTSALAGLIIGGPVIFYQLWRFITPGLTSRERRYALPFVVFSQLLFVLGVWFAYQIIPRGLGILLGFGGEQIAPLLSAGKYLSFVLSMAVAFGIVFEIPIVLIFLSLAGIVSARGLRKARPYALLINTVVAAIVTPTTDVVTLFFLAGPMALLYELSIVAAWLIERSRRRRAGTP